MKVVFVYGTGLSSWLTRLFTGSRCYHVGFTDGVQFWDMHLIRRRRNWATYRAQREILAVECPVRVSRDYFENELDHDESRYGVWDYLLFGLRPLFHLVGKSTRNCGGVICSEMVCNDLAAHGWQPGWQFQDVVPSPADLEELLIGRRNALDRSPTWP
jgi:hypothetical protein